MKQFLKILIVIFISIIATGLTIKLVYFVGETFFFDKLFYKKSAAHGYMNGNYLDIIKSNQKTDKRFADLRNLLNEDAKVLGISDNTKFKIAIIGDSYTYGTGLKYEDRYPVLLEKMLNKTRPTKVFSLAIPGRDFLDYLYLYDLAKQKINPDLYIIAMVDNDFGIRRDLNDFQKNFVEQNSDHCGNNISYNRWLEKYSDWNYYFLDLLYPASTEIYSNQCLMEKAIAYYEMNKTIFIPFNEIPKEKIVIPDTFKNTDEEENYKVQDLMYRYAQTVRESNGYILEVNYSQVPPDKLRVSKEEGHFSKHTNKYIAETLFNEISGNNKWMFFKD